MQIDDEVMNLLLIEENASKISFVRRELETNQVRHRLNTIDHGKSALAYLRRIGPYENVPAPDLVLFDFSEPDRNDWLLLKKLTLGPRPIPTPVVLLTSAASEKLLESRFGSRQNLSLFAPLDLASFLQRMTNSHRERFLNALSLISKLGLVTIRLPASCLHQGSHDLTAMSA